MALKRVFGLVFKWIIFKPGYRITRFFFYFVVVRFYSHYLSFVKKMGWGPLRKRPVSFLFSHKLVHIVVVLVSVILIFINLTSKTKAEGLTETAHKTILADLIKTDFSVQDEDEQLIIETFDRELEVSDLQQTYLDNLSNVRPQAGISPGQEEEEDLYSKEGTIVRLDKISTEVAKRPRKEKITYVVEQGDTISTIAEKFEISVSTILWENNLSSYSIIRPGDELVILPMSGLTHKVKSGENLSFIAKKYGVEESEISSANKITDTSSLKAGQELMIPGGRKEYAQPAPAKKYTGISAITDIVKVPSSKPVAGNKMAWPTEGYTITQYYTWKHHGLDIANRVGTPIYAADSGVVEVAGWGTGYGNQIVINHGGGKKTRYGHCSKFYVQKGDHVTKGQAIAAMGSTGWSTGSHLHFEVIINGIKYNPLNYIK